MKRTALVRRTPLRRSAKPIAGGKGIRRVSLKQRKRNDAYSQARREFLDDLGALNDGVPICQVADCHAIAVQVHHKRGRIGDRLTDPSGFLGVCSACHERIEANPAWARANGYSLRR